MAQIRQEISLWNALGTINASSDLFAVADLDTATYDGTVSYRFELAGSVTSGSSILTLRRKGTTTDDASLTVSATSTALISVAFTPPAGATEYILRTDANAVSSGLKLRAVRIVVLQSATPITKTQTQIEIGGNVTASTSTVKSPLSFPKYWLYDSSRWNGTLAFFAEAVYFAGNTKGTVTVILQEDDGSFAWSDLTTIVSAGSASTQTSVRVSFTPTSNRHYRIVFSASSTKGSANVANCRVVITQTGSPTLMELQYLLGTTNPGANTNLMGFLTSWDPAEWSGVSNTYIYEVETAASTTLVIELDDVNSVQVAGSSISNPVNYVQSGVLTMPAAINLDSRYSSYTSGTVHATRILVRVSISSVSVDMWHPTANQPYPERWSVVSY